MKQQFFRAMQECQHVHKVQNATNTLQGRVLVFLIFFAPILQSHKKSWGKNTARYKLYISYVIPAPLQFSGLIELESKDFFLFLQGQGDLDVEFSIRVQLDIGRFWYVRMFDLDGLQQCKLRLGNVKLAPVESVTIFPMSFLGG